MLNIWSILFNESILSSYVYSYYTANRIFIENNIKYLLDETDSVSYMAAFGDDAQLRKKVITPVIAKRYMNTVRDDNPKINEVANYFVKK